MLKSMTGFGAGRATISGLEIEVELKSVNSRFLDLSWKLPGGLARFEGELSRTVRSHFRRGRIEVYVSRRATADTQYQVQFQKPLFDAYLGVYKEALAAVGGAPSAEQLQRAAVQILKKPEVLELQSSSAELELSGVEAALLEAVTALAQMRGAEGAVLEAELLHRVSLVERAVAAIRPHVEGSVQAYRERLLTKVKRLFESTEYDQSRFHAEVGLFAERCDVEEELTRLDSHCGQFREAIAKNDGGKKLEFILQEMGREVNTIGSKSQSSEISQIVVECKAELEKMREQVQNVE